MNPVTKMLGTLRADARSTPLPCVELVPFVAEQHHPTGSPTGVVAMPVREVLQKYEKSIPTQGQNAKKIKLWPSVGVQFSTFATPPERKHQLGSLASLASLVPLAH